MLLKFHFSFFLLHFVALLIPFLSFTCARCTQLVCFRVWFVFFLFSIFWTNKYFGDVLVSNLVKYDQKCLLLCLLNFKNRFISRCNWKAYDAVTFPMCVYTSRCCGRFGLFNWKQPKPLAINKSPAIFQYPCLLWLITWRKT